VTAPLRTPLATLFTGLAAALGVGEVYFGQRYLAEHDGPPRAVLVPSAGTFEAPIQYDADQLTVAMEWSTFAAHFWAVDVDAAREMERALAAYLQDRFPSCARLEGAAWPPNETVQDGELVIVRFAVQEPLVLAAPTTVTITATGFDTSGAVAGDGLLTAGED